MKIHKYDDDYATKNGVNGVKELILSIIIGVIGLITPAILLGLGTIKFITALIIWTIVIIILICIIKKRGVINIASMSVIIENGNDLIYMMINPNLEGSMFPKNFVDLLAGPTATYASNKIEAEVEASNIAQNEELVTALFNYYKDNNKNTFKTIMYGKPVYFKVLLNKDFKKEYKKIYTVDCLKENGRKSKVKIPNVYPTFFK